MDKPQQTKLSKLEKLYSEAQADFNLTALNLSDKTRMAPSLKNKWCFRLVSEEKLLRKLEDTCNKMIDMYVEANKLNPGGIVKAKINADKQEEIQKVQKQIIMQKDVLRFLQLILDNQVKTYTWDIKNAIEQTKLESM